MTPSGFSVLLAGVEDLQIPVLAKALAKFNGVPVPDAAVQARKAWGFAAENISEAEAGRLLAELQASGLRGRAVPSSSLHGLPEAMPVAGIDFSSDALRITVGREPVRILPPDRVAVLSAVGLKISVTHKVKVQVGPSAAQKAVNMGIMMATGLPIGIGKKKKEVEKTETVSDLFFTLDLVTRDPAERYRVDGQRFDYSCLGDKKGMGVVGNFRGLLGELSGRAPAALRNKGAEAMLKGQPLATLGYETMDDFERETRWLANLV